MKKRILFLISDTGGGHRAAARAIEEAIQTLYPAAYETIIEDIWRGYAGWPINKIPDAYGWLTGPGLWLWRLLWGVSFHLKAHQLLFPLVRWLARPHIIPYLRRVKPDLVVSVHPLLNHLGLQFVREAGLDAPFVTVVTDMVTIHPAWICPQVTRCLVPTDVAQAQALKLGMPPAKTAVCGQPVSLKFTKSSNNKREIRSKLGLAENRRTVMLVGGGEGVGRLFEIARALARLGSQIQLLIVAGRNERLKKNLKPWPGNSLPGFMALSIIWPSSWPQPIF